MLKYLYKTAFIALLGVLSFQESFAQCPSRVLRVMGDTVCSNSTDAYVTISNTKVGDIFQAFLGTVAISSPIVSSEGDVMINVKVSLLQIGKNNVVIKHTVGGCETISFSNDPVIVVNQLPRTDQRIVSKPYCLGSSAASIIIYSTRPGEIYQPYLNAAAIGASVQSVADTVLFNISTSGLPGGLKEIYFVASVAGCALVQLENKGYVMPAPFVDYFYSVVGDTICHSNSYAELLFRNTYPEVNHQIYINNIAVLEPFKGENNDFIKKIPTSLLRIGSNEIRVQAEIESRIGCGSTFVTTTASVLTHPGIKFNEPILIGDTVTLPMRFASIKLIGAIQGIKYKAVELGTQIGDSAIALGQDTLILRIPAGAPNGLQVGTHDFTVSFTTFGCEEQTISLKTKVVVKPELTTSIEDKLNTTNFAVYPNPFSSEITITSKLKGQLKMQITDAIGNIVHQESISNAQDLKLNPELKSGLYFLQMESEGARETVKLVKQ